MSSGTLGRATLRVFRATLAPRGGSGACVACEICASAAAEA
jgi:hypothetical protein